MPKPLKPDYEVGYARPPRHSQFKKGQSGNAAGRPKGKLNVATELERALSETVVVNEGGRRHAKSKFQIAITQLANKAAAGDLKAVRMMLDLVALVNPVGTGAANAPDLAVDREVAAKIMRRLLGDKESNTTGDRDEPEDD